MSKFAYKGYGWVNQCMDANCYYHQPSFIHTHYFTIGKSIKKQCKTCRCEMDAAQIHEPMFGKNELILRNAYICKTCGANENLILYHGIPSDPQRISAKANAFVATLDL